MLCTMTTMRARTHRASRGAAGVTRGTGWRGVLGIVTVRGVVTAAIDTASDRLADDDIDVWAVGAPAVTNNVSTTSVLSRSTITSGTYHSMLTYNI